MVDLAIVGPGVLGSLVAEQYMSTNPVAKVVLVFRSEDTERRDRCINYYDGWSFLQWMVNVVLGWKRRVTK